MGLRKYQAYGLNSCLTMLKTYNSLLLVLPTGGGKTYMFSELSKYVVSKGFKVLILVHREELMNQAGKNFDNPCLLNSSSKDIDRSKNIFIGMVETVNNMLKKDTDCLSFINFTIIDEAHILIFDKVLKQIKGKKVGFTATAGTTKKIKFTEGGVAKSKIVTLKHYFDEILVVSNTAELISQCHLVKDKTYTIKLPTHGMLVDSKTNPDGYTNQSLTKAYSNQAALEMIKKAYNSVAKGKKSIIFNPNTTVNKKVYNLFKSMNVPCRMFDSVNNSKKERKEILEWYSKTPNGVLINVSVFTTGFDEPSIEVVFVNRATKSLNLYHQMCGRGSRLCESINKTNFIIVDLGNNVAQHGLWSDPVDWKEFFHKDHNVRKLTYDLESVWFCECGRINNAAEKECGDCKINKEQAREKPAKKRDKNGELVEVRKPVIPTASSIIKYCIDNNKKSITFAYKILDIQIMDVIISSGMSRKLYYKDKKAIDKRITHIYSECYYVINRAKYTHNFEGKNRKRQTLIDAMLKKIIKFYDN